MKDRTMQALSLHALDPIAATLADPNSYGLRKERRCAEAMEQCATVLSNGTRPQWILAGDIPSCCDTIRHPSFLRDHGHKREEDHFLTNRGAPVMTSLPREEGFWQAATPREARARLLQALRIELLGPETP